MSGGLSPVRADGDSPAGLAAPGWLAISRGKACLGRGLRIRDGGVKNAGRSLSCERPGKHRSALPVNASLVPQSCVECIRWQISSP